MNTSLKEENQTSHLLKVRRRRLGDQEGILVTVLPNKSRLFACH